MLIYDTNLQWVILVISFTEESSYVDLFCRIVEENNKLWDL